LRGAIGVPGNRRHGERTVIRSENDSAKNLICAASTLTAFRRIWFSLQGSADFAARSVLG
jgi:hypothetical protein